MSSEIPQPPFIFEGAEDVELEEPRPPAALSDGVLRAIDALKTAVEAARKPGMPLSILSNVAREAPLGSLLVAFMLGVMVGRRR
ncbi:MAG: hypothetical protein EKK40_02395 [Bradyrhizobiaceae bacterium]|nr:MAG: hypothetical protein EKK40_02395 [Bradyrhizobiaceae bacterium]